MTYKYNCKQGFDVAQGSRVPPRGQGCHQRPWGVAKDQGVSQRTLGCRNGPWGVAKGPGVSPMAKGSRVLHRVLIKKGLCSKEKKTRVENMPLVFVKSRGKGEG